MKYEFLKDNLLIICPNSYKKNILEYLNKEKKILNIKFMTMDEYIKKIKFDYDVLAIVYLVNRGMKVENAITFLDNLLYIEDKDYGNEKLNFLVSLKKELDDNHLLIYDSLFKTIVDRYEIVIYGYGMIDKWEKSLFNNEKIIDYPIVNTSFKVYSIENISDEVEFIFQKISKMLSDGIDINKISLMNIDNEYIPIIKRFSLLYHIPVDLDSNNTLMGTRLGSEFYSLVLKNKKREEIVNELTKYQDSKNYATLINILNKYLEFDIKDLHEEIKYELLNTKVKRDNYTNCIKIKHVFDDTLDDEYVFLANFNNPTIPNLSFDIDYITDDIKDLVGLLDTSSQNELVKRNTINYLKSIKNLYISCKKVTPFNTYYPSILLDDINYELLEYKRTYSYSKESNKSIYSMYLDDFVRYGIKNKDLDLLYTAYGKNDYLAYNNEFSGIEKDTLIKYLNNELVLSYSSIDNYYKCGFRYYLSNILKIDLYEETFMTIIGNIFHDVLRHMNDDCFNLDKRYNMNISDKTLSEKEKFFLEKLKHDLEFVIEVIKKHQFITGFNKMLYEKKIDITLKNSPYVHFKGFVDKIMYKENNHDTLVSIIDYKTGNPDIKIKNLEFGLSMQLPIYLYLVKNSNLFPNIKFAGFYLQHILNNGIKKDKKTLEEEKYDNMKLLGYSTNNLERLAIFDSTMEDSEMIKNMKLNKDGSIYHHANTLSDEEIDNIIKLIELKIKEAMEEILEGKFLINPKIIDGENVSCKYCKFNDICYREEKNYIYLKRRDGDNCESNTNTEDGD